MSAAGRQRDWMPASWITRAGAGMVGMAWLVTALLLSTPCTGDITCAAEFGLVIFAPVATALSVGLAVWWVGGRVGLLILTSLLAGLPSAVIAASGAAGPAALLFLGLSVLMVVVVALGGQELRIHQGERWLTITALALAAAVAVYASLWPALVAMLAVIGWILWQAAGVGPSRLRRAHRAGATLGVDAPSDEIAIEPAGWSPTVWVAHLLAIGVVLLLAWVVIQPQGEGIAFWNPGFAVFLIISAWLIATNLFAWWRWRRWRVFVAVDLLALIPIGIISQWYLFIPAIPVAMLLLVGLAAGSTGRAGLGHHARAPRPVPTPVIAVLLAAVAVVWWFAVTWAFDPFNQDLLRYSMADAMTGGVALAAVVLWLDRRPGALAGFGAWALYAGVSWSAAWIGYLIEADEATRTFVEPLVYGSVLGAAGVVSLVTAGRETVRRSVPRDRALSAAVGLVTGILLVVEPLLAPIGIVLAVLLEPAATSSQTGTSIDHPEAALRPADGGT